MGKTIIPDFNCRKDYITQRNRPCCVILLRPIQEQTAGAE